MRSHPLAVRFLWALSVLAASCSSATEAEPPDREFVLTVFQDVQVPGVFEEVDMGTAEILSGDFRLLGKGSCGGTLAFRTTIGGEVFHHDYEAGCTWTQEGEALTISWTHTNPTFGTLAGSRLTLIHRIDVMCVTMPCPTSEWVAEYVELDKG